ncbi:hypothetical protein FRB95_008643 [Tulasnella sp. JGI-2019a]|nr:hypothetical protein FRB95_008643 [Tulasnella sp. JGI-2019a]
MCLGVTDGQRLHMRKGDGARSRLDVVAPMAFQQRTGRKAPSGLMADVTSNCQPPDVGEREVVWGIFGCGVDDMNGVYSKNDAGQCLNDALNDPFHYGIERKRQLLEARPGQEGK